MVSHCVLDMAEILNIDKHFQVGMEEHKANYKRFLAAISLCTIPKLAMYSIPFAVSKPNFRKYTMSNP